MRAALLIGIDNYDHLQPLHGCVNDVRELTPLLERDWDGDTNFQCHTLVGRTTREIMMTEIDRLFAMHAEAVLFYFSGHGISATGEDLTLATIDGEGYTLGVNLAEILERVIRSNAREQVIVLDACYSGASIQSALPGMHVGLPHGATILASSRGDQRSAEQGRGEFSEALCEGLAGAAADVMGEVRAPGLYSHINESFGAFGPRPVLRANISGTTALRRCQPMVTIEELSRLAKLFPELHQPLELSPAFEATAMPRDFEAESNFAVLQACRAAGLVAPESCDHLYDEAMSSGRCWLTPIGRRYCDRVRAGTL